MVLSQCINSFRGLDSLLGVIIPLVWFSVCAPPKVVDIKLRKWPVSHFSMEFFSLHGNNKNKGPVVDRTSKFKSCQDLTYRTVESMALAIFSRIWNRYD